MLVRHHVELTRTFFFLDFRTLLLQTPYYKREAGRAQPWDYIKHARAATKYHCDPVGDLALPS